MRSYYLPNKAYAGFQHGLQTKWRDNPDNGLVVHNQKLGNKSQRMGMNYARSIYLKLILSCSCGALKGAFYHLEDSCALTRILNFGFVVLPRNSLFSQPSRFKNQFTNKRRCKTGIPWPYLCYIRYFKISNLYLCYWCSYSSVLK